MNCGISFPETKTLQRPSVRLAQPLHRRSSTLYAFPFDVVPFSIHKRLNKVLHPAPSISFPASGLQRDPRSLRETALSKKSVSLEKLQVVDVLSERGSSVFCGSLSGLPADMFRSPREDTALHYALAHFCTGTLESTPQMTQRTDATAAALSSTFTHSSNLA